MAGEDPNAALRRIIIAAVFSAWLVSFIASLAISGYQTSPWLNAMATAVVAWATGKEVLHRNGGVDR